MTSVSVIMKKTQKTVTKEFTIGAKNTVQ